MPLNFPHSGQKNELISKNLDTLFAVGHCNVKPHPDIVATQVALDCFKDIKNAQLGILHSLEKYTVGSLAFAGTICLPMAILGTAVYQYLPTSPTGVLSLGVSLASFSAMNFVSDKTIGVKPLTFLTTLAVAGLTYGAGKVSDAAVRRYNVKEKKVEDFSKERHATIISQLKTTYNATANELLSRYSKVSEQPRDLYELKLLVEKLEKALPDIRKAFACLGIASSEASEILNQLKDAMATVTNASLALRTGTKENAADYNIRLLVELPVNAANEIALSQKTQEAIQEAKKGHFGIAYTLKGWTATALSGCATMSALGLSAIAAAERFFPEADSVINGDKSNFAVTLAVHLGVCGALAASVKTGQVVYNIFHKRQKENESRYHQQVVQVKQELTSVYRGIAGQLLKRYKKASSNVNELKKFKSEMAVIQQKMPIIHTNYQKQGIFINSEEITADLDSFLKSISV